MDVAADLDRCRHGCTATETCLVCDVGVEWAKVDERAPLFRCSVCLGLYRNVDRDTHAAGHAA